jgi:hypothetical protein
MTAIKFSDVLQIYASSPDDSSSPPNDDASGMDNDILFLRGENLLRPRSTPDADLTIL